jgi:hypothetical protein
MKSDCRNRFRFKRDGEDALVKAIKNSGMTLEDIHRAYCDIYNSDVSLEWFEAAVMTPYTVSEYHIGQRVEVMMEAWMD